MKDKSGTINREKRFNNSAMIAAEFEPKEKNSQL